MSEVPRLQAVPLEYVPFGVHWSHPQHRIPESGITEPHLIAYGPVGVPLYDLVRALVRTVLGHTEPSSPDFVRRALEHLPDGVLEDLGISITHESVRWMNLGDEVFVAIDGEPLREWISAGGDWFPAGETVDFREVVLNRYASDSFVPDNGATSAAASRAGGESLQLLPPSDSVHVAGIASPVSGIGLWYLTQEDRSGDYPSYDCALIIADADPCAALVEAFIAWGGSNTHVLLSTLRKLEAIADSEKHRESAAWEGVTENSGLAYSAAAIWSLIGVGVDADGSLAGSRGRVILGRSVESERAWHEDTRNAIVRTVQTYASDLDAF